MARLSTKMLIWVTPARPKMTARATTTAPPPTTSGTPAATTEPKTSSRATAASGRRPARLAAQVVLGDGLDVAVERRPAGQRARRRARPAASPVARARPERVRRVVGRQVEGDDVVDGPAVDPDLVRRQAVGQDPGHVRGAGHRGPRPARRPRTAAIPPRRSRSRDDDQRGRGETELTSSRARARAASRRQGEATGPERRRGARGEGQREQEDDGPSGDDPAAPPMDEPTEPLEGGHDRAPGPARAWPARAYTAGTDGHGSIVAAMPGTLRGRRPVAVRPHRPHRVC